MKPRALLLDAGGTLIPEQSLRESDLVQRAQSLQSVFPELSLIECRSLVARMADSAQKAEQSGIQHSDSMTAELLDEARPGLGVRAAFARRALVRVGWDAIRPCPGTTEMLLEARRLGLRTALVSNTAWLSEEDYRLRLQDMGLSGHFDHLVSSFDIGVRKPDRAMFDAAVHGAGCTAQECVMVGDSEVNDISAAASLGMRTIRVTMQYPIAGSTAADAVAASPIEICRILRSWCAEE